MNACSQNWSDIVGRNRSSAKKLSVIIATRNRAHAIQDCLDSVAKAITEAGVTEHAEIVVVDNGSTDGTAQLVNSWGARLAVPINLVVEPIPGLSRARNAGIIQSFGDLLAFTDDDCRMSRSYVKELLAYDSYDDELVLRSGSVILGDPADLPLTIKKVETVQSWKRPLPVEGEGRLLSALIGCNMTMRRSVVELVGPFDVALGAGTACPAGEDTDYFYRAYLAGVRLEMVPNLIVEHFHGRRTETDRIKLLRNYEIGNGALAAKYIVRYPNFARHIIWQLRRSLPKIFEKYPGINVVGRLSERDRLRCMILGIYRYLLGRVVGYTGK